MFYDVDIVLCVSVNICIFYVEGFRSLDLTPTGPYQYLLAQWGILTCHLLNGEHDWWIDGWTVLVHVVVIVVRYTSVRLFSIVIPLTLSVNVDLI